MGKAGAAETDEVALAGALALPDLLLQRPSRAAGVLPLEIEIAAREDQLRQRVNPPRHRAVGAAPGRCHLVVSAATEDDLPDLADQLEVGAVARVTGPVGNLIRLGQPVHLARRAGEEAVQRGGHQEDQSGCGGRGHCLLLSSSGGAPLPTSTQLTNEGDGNRHRREIGPQLGSPGSTMSISRSRGATLWQLIAPPDVIERAPTGGSGSAAPSTWSFRFF